MKKSKFTEQQIAFGLKQAETGTKVDEVCRKMGISEETFYNWKKKYGGLCVSELRRLRQLEAPRDFFERRLKYSARSIDRSSTYSVVLLHQPPQVQESPLA